MAVAEALGGTIINADSAQVYADLRLLSARPGPDDETRVPHRLFGHVDGAADYSAARWATEARAAIDATIAEQRVPILVGGTGLYLRTLLDGIAPVPDIDPAIRAEVRALPVEVAHARLRDVDRESAERLAPADTTRVARALEVALSTGKPIAAWQAARVGGIAGTIDLVPIILLPPRDWLFARCDQRLAAMFDAGAREEVAALLNRKDIAATAPVRRAIGVREIAAWIAGDCARETALAQAQLATRQYAKRQFTWFRNQPPADWPRNSEIEKYVLVVNFVRRLSL